jgi:hypothetical protein
MPAGKRRDVAIDRARESEWLIRAVAAASSGDSPQVHVSKEVPVGPLALNVTRTAALA